MKSSSKNLNHSLVNAHSLWRDVLAIKEHKPLIHNITNYVTMDFVANLLLASGASPVMAHAIEEIEDMCSLANALVINIGTLSESWVKSMKRAFEIAQASHIPTVFDPVGAGATKYRTQMAIDLIRNGSPTVIRGNASEISAIAKLNYSTKGVESTLEPKEILKEAQELSFQTKSIVVVSGASDYVVSNEDIAIIHNGHAMMSKVTGMGCGATALIGTFLAVNKSLFQATIHAMAYIGIAGEMASKNMQGPGSFRTAFIDCIFGMEENDIETYLKMEIL